MIVDVKAKRAVAKIEPPIPSTAFGFATASGFDFDGDGHTDFAITGRSAKSDERYVALYSSRDKVSRVLVEAEAMHEAFGYELAVLGGGVDSRIVVASRLAADRERSTLTWFNAKGEQLDQRVAPDNGPLGGLASLVVAPDLDGDGFGDLLAGYPSLKWFGGRVDVLSGKKASKILGIGEDTSGPPLNEFGCSVCVLAGDPPRAAIAGFGDGLPGGVCVVGFQKESARVVLGRDE